jgi:choline dehydrogenase-like flavoprotein
MKNTDRQHSRDCGHDGGEHADIIIVGGGPVGALAALRFAAAGRRVLLVEARAKDAPLTDARALALSWYSREALARPVHGRRTCPPARSTACMCRSRVHLAEPGWMRPISNCRIWAWWWIIRR